MRTQAAQSVEFLQWVLPCLGLRWLGFRRVRRQVIKRIARRIETLQLPDFDAYRRYLKSHQQEWPLLDGFCRITISRFYRDRPIFDILAQEGLPELVGLCRSRSERRLLCWSAGCGAGEEAYTLVLIWVLHLALQAPDIFLSVVATDADAAQISRAQNGCYARSTLKELPPSWRDIAFSEAAGRYCIKPEYRQTVKWGVQDLRNAIPEGRFDLILCRNLAFTYFSTDLQRQTLHRLATAMLPGGLLVLGAHEVLPESSWKWTLWRPGLPIYRKRG